MQAFVSDCDRDVYYGDPYFHEEGFYAFEQQGWNDAKCGKQPQSDNCFYRRGYDAFRTQAPHFAKG
ncbi:hypothetical protein H6G20_09905 [Desertifilum sp. FACHB-1129]|uniref:Uncharacterized protein n=2 Tax=Desertifilum tharense IPPAS B-1220 TaxID=1781255 RepID=A0A1E5QKX2_9CYAN|nr:MULTISPECIES: hypothetical protein [Desertifilum]MDA0211742.1 hypothetical protein [Cyanobacteria bacterium FC1]MBD2311972.1 hypothetical protein [Desertifilum sp. FACHB-1129]MBD2322424.1 hypothetical protein [Desertifilum sp. FACHB-866]MBD2332587.1 hypothetical protein [Desertifilum sp. FACHB-868]OEJ75332.1 hypothetical protein BH720_10060 [Desertifilum tharense IPPAS B-1220]